MPSLTSTILTTRAPYKKIKYLRLLTTPSKVLAGTDRFQPKKSTNSYWLSTKMEMEKSRSL